MSSIAFGLELVAELPVRLLFLAGGVLLPPVNGAATNEPAAAGSDHATESQPAAGDHMSQVLALLQGQKVAMSTMETSLCNFEETIAFMGRGERDQSAHRVCAP